MSKNNHSLLLYQIFFVLLWSSGAIVIEFGLKYINPFFFVLLRMILATIFMLGVCIITKAPWPKNANVLTKIIFAGLLTQCSYVVSYFCALYYGVSPMVMTIILGLQPILTAFIYNIFFKNKISNYQVLGLGLGLLGVILIVVHDFSMQKMTMVGCILAVICLCSITIGSIIQKNNPEMDIRTGSTIQFAISIIPVFILNLVFGSFNVNVTPTFLASLGWMSIVVSVIATYLFYTLLKRNSTVSVSSLFYLVPGITAVLCYFIFHELISIQILVGILFVTFSVILTNFNPNSRQLSVAKGVIK